MSSSTSSDKVKENLSKWEELSPLSEQQLKSVLLLAQVNHLDDDDEENKEDEEKKPSVPTTPTTTAAKMCSDENRLQENINELLYNFDVNDIEDPRIERYVHSLQRNSAKCGQISGLIDNAFQHLNVLVENYAHVSQKTRSLHVACEQLLSDQVISSLVCF